MFHSPKLVRQALQTCAARTISQRPDILKQWEYMFAYMFFQLRYTHLGLSTRASHCTDFIRIHLEDHLNGSD